MDALEAGPRWSSRSGSRPTAENPQCPRPSVPSAPSAPPARTHPRRPVHRSRHRPPEAAPQIPARTPRAAPPACRRSRSRIGCAGLSSGPPPRDAGRDRARTDRRDHVKAVADTPAGAALTAPCARGPPKVQRQPRGPPPFSRPGPPPPPPTPRRPWPHPDRLPAPDPRGRRHPCRQAPRRHGAPTPPHRSGRPDRP